MDPDIGDMDDQEMNPAMRDNGQETREHERVAQAVPAALNAVGLMPRLHPSPEPMAQEVNPAAQPAQVYVNPQNEQNGNVLAGIRITETADPLYISLVNFNFRWDIAGNGLNHRLPVCTSVLDLELNWELSLYLEREQFLMLGVSLLSMRPRRLSIKAKCFTVVDESEDDSIEDPVLNLEYTDVNTNQRLPLHSSVTLKRIEDVNEELGFKVVKMSITAQRRAREVDRRNRLARDLRALLYSEENCDVRFSIGDEFFNLHRAVLASRSPGFRKLLARYPPDPLTCINVAEEDPITFRQMIKFIYYGEVDDLEKDALSLLLAAERWEIDDLKTVCEEQLNIENPSQYNVPAPHGPIELPRVEIRFYHRNR